MIAQSPCPQKDNSLAHMCQDVQFQAVAIGYGTCWHYPQQSWNNPNPLWVAFAAALHLGHICIFM